MCPTVATYYVLTLPPRSADLLREPDFEARSVQGELGWSEAGGRQVSIAVIASRGRARRMWRACLLS